MLRVLVCLMTVKGGADAEKKLEGVTEIVAVIAVESVRTIVDGELGAETDIDAITV